jgi:hypothetical protein
MLFFNLVSLSILSVVRSSLFDRVFSNGHGPAGAVVVVVVVTRIVVVVDDVDDEVVVFGKTEVDVEELVVVMSMVVVLLLVVDVSKLGSVAAVMASTETSPCPVHCFENELPGEKRRIQRITIMTLIVLRLDCISHLSFKDWMLLNRKCLIN